ASAVIVSPNSASTAVNVSGAGTVTMRLTSTSNQQPSCGTATSDVVLTVNPVATVNAGADLTVPICDSTTVSLAGSIGGGASSATWTTNGSGSFSPNANALNAVYTPSQADLAAGSVTLTLATNDPAGPCGPVNDTVVITFAACPDCIQGPGVPLPARSEVG